MNITKLNELSSSKIGVSQKIWPKEWAQWNYMDNHPHWEKVQQVAKEYQVPCVITRDEVTQAITSIRLNVPSQQWDHNMAGPSNGNRYFTRSTKRSLEKKELYKKKHGFNWWMKEGYLSSPSTPSTSAKSNDAR
ncbi:hypothetical protein KY284_001039 [Solanum tuberosum]|nr:hypothetical protein KY284_001039 [Solanum tuberosum]